MHLKFQNNLSEIARSEDRASFNIELGSILGFSGAVVDTLYKSNKNNGEY